MLLTNSVPTDDNQALIEGVMVGGFFQDLLTVGLQNILRGVPKLGTSFLVTKICFILSLSSFPSKGDFSSMGLCKETNG